MDVRAGFFDDRVEHGRIADRQLAEHLAVEFNPRGNERRNKSIVMHAARPQRRAQSRDPECSEMPLPLSAVAIGIYAGLAGEFDGGAIKRPRSRAETAGGFQDSFAIAGVGWAAG